MTFTWLRTWQLGVKSLLLHPMRSLLTVLGIFIGVASVIWLLAIGEGISLKAQQQIQDLGATNIIVRTTMSSEDALTSDDFFPEYGIKRSDYDVLVSTIPTIQHALRIREIRRMAYYGTRKVDTRLVGCTPEYSSVMRLQIEEGHFITDTEMSDGGEKVCVLGSETARKLFPLERRMGKLIRVEDDEFLVVGVMEPRTAMAGVGGSLAAQEFNHDIYIPVTTFWSRIGDGIYTRRAGSRSGEVMELNQLTIQVGSVDEVLSTAEAVKTTLALRHEDDDYAIVVPLELLRQAETTRLMFMLLMGMIAAISLVVGGIGIMNIMLATVTERTREIGIRRALGAKRGDITRQFLVETIALSVVGGATGVLAGLTCPMVVAWVRSGLERMFADSFESMPDLVRTVTPVIVPESIPIAFGIAVAVGVAFGLYPAIRAASMDPIEALRHE